MGVIRFMLRSQGGTMSKLARVARRVAVITISISVAVMIVAFAVVGGYKEVLTQSLRGVMGDFKLEGRDPGARWVTMPISVDSSMIAQIESTEGVESVVPMINSSAVIKTGGTIKGVALAGISRFDIGKTMLRGVQLDESVAFSDGVILAESLTRKLGLEIGDEVDLLFFYDQPVLLTLTLSGVFNTHIAEVDEAIGWVDIDRLNALGEYSDGEVGFYQITAKNGVDMVELYENLDQFSSPEMALISATTQYEHIFDWIYLLDNNIALLMIIVSIVAGINIISVVLISILENTLTIGVLKSVGMKNHKLTTLYTLKTLNITIRGVVAGVLLGVLFCALQSHFGIVTLDPESYLVDSVPIALSVVDTLYVACGAIAISTIFAMLPTFVISRISPHKTLKFE